MFGGLAVSQRMQAAAFVTIAPSGWLTSCAIEAMAGVVGRPRELTIVTTRSSASEVVVEVRDSGTGVAQDRVERIFESFYTTKPEGIGIGLSISRSIVEAHGGRLWASSNQPHGAVFRLSLPIAQESTA